MSEVAKVLTFDEGPHEYRLNGILIPSVTQVLSVFDSYAGVPANILAEAADRGTAVHRATELYDADDLDFGSLDDALIGYVEAWMKFLDDKKPELVAIEKRTYHPKMGYAGTLDRELILDGFLSVLDIKSCFKMMPSTGPQTWAYMDAENAHRKAKADHIKKRYGLQLKRDGNYELHLYRDNVNDSADFIAALRLKNWQMKYHGKKH